LHTHTEAYGRKTALSGRRWTMSSWPNFTHLYPFLSSSVEKKLNRLVRNQANSFELVFLQIYLLLTLDVLTQGVTSFSSLLIYFRHWLQYQISSRFQVTTTEATVQTASCFSMGLIPSFPFSHGGYLQLSSILIYFNSVNDNRYGFNR
jgi:hypothetical protein